MALDQGADRGGVALADQQVALPLGSLALLLVFAVSMGSTAGAVRGDVPAGPDMLVAGLVQLPAILVIAALVVAVTAPLPRWARRPEPSSWSRSCSARCSGAATLQLPKWAQDASPFTHIPRHQQPTPPRSPLSP
jgi:polyether ionophore transport system permease protein